MDEDNKWNARRVLGCRKYAALACKALTLAESVPALEDWFRAEAENRTRHDIRKGDREYDAIVSAAAAYKAKLLADAQKGAAAIPTTEQSNGDQLENRMV